MKLNTPNRILLDSLKGKETDQVIAEVIAPAINSIIDDVYLSLDKNIDESNLKNQITVLDITTTSTYPVISIKIAVTIKDRPKACQVLQCMEKPSFTPIELPGTLAWKYENGFIIIKKLTGLAASTKYTITFEIR